MSSARPHPPSAQRIAEARAQGHVPRAPLAGVAAAALGLLAGGHWAVGAMGGRLRELARAPLEALAQGDRAAAFARAEDALGALAGDLAAWLAGGLACVVGVGLWAQGAAFGALRRRTSTRFAALQPSRAASLLWLSCLALCAGMAVYDAVDAPLTALPHLLGTCAERAFALTLPCMVVDAALARARFRASLWLTRRELQDAQREAYGHPLIRAARARLARQRRADRAEVPR